MLLINSVGGIPELVDRSRWHDTLFEANAVSLRARLLYLLGLSSWPAPQAAIDPAGIHERWHDLFQSLPATAVRPAVPATLNPLVSVCITTRNRPKLLQQAVASVLNQTYRSIQIVIVDDVSGQ